MFWWETIFYSSTLVTVCEVFAHSILLFSRSPMPVQRNFSAQLQLKVRPFFLSTALKCCQCDGVGELPFPRCYYHVEIGLHALRRLSYLCVVIQNDATAIMHHIHKADPIYPKRTGFSTLRREFHQYFIRWTQSSGKTEKVMQVFVFTICNM